MTVGRSEGMNSEERFSVLVAGGRMRAWAVLILLTAAFSPASRAGLIWDNPGNALSNFNNPTSGLDTVDLGSQYAFQFEGVTYNSIIVSTAGFIWLGGSNTSECCVLTSSAAAASYFNSGAARIAPGWADLLTNLGGSVDFNQVTDANGSRSVITWQSVPTTSPANGTADVTFQVQLYTSGQIIFSYQSFNWADLGSNTATVIGVTPGGAAPYLDVDFTTIGGSLSVPSGGIYDYQSSSANPGMDLSGQSFILNPTASSVTVTSTIPEPSTLIPLTGFLFFGSLIRRRQIRSTKYKL
jgi:hypothetical protein